MKKMADPMERFPGQFTNEDYQSWPDDERWELIEGVAYDMSAAPTSTHQSLVVFLLGEIYQFLKGKKCKVFISPFDVFFPEEEDQKFGKIRNVVEPDVVVICDPEKIIKKGCLGAPDMVAEVLSPSTSKKDLNEKFRLFEKHGVREYWVIDPGNKFVEIFSLETEGKAKGKYDEGTLIPPANWREENFIAASKVLDGFQIDIRELFGMEEV